ncbi:hypothetical protein J6590_092813 [Homalodisca vitripennis]|nr:hypothetical protein J6590_092813 [Homalodisca vitripennis]
MYHTDRQTSIQTDCYPTPKIGPSCTKFQSSFVQGLGLPVLKAVAEHSPLFLEPTAMAAVKLLCAPRLEGLGLPVLKAVAVHSSLLLEPTAMAVVTLLYSPRLEHSMVLGLVLGQVVTLLPCNTPLPYWVAVENEIKCADITGDLETKPVNVPNLVSTPSKPREKAGDQRKMYEHRFLRDTGANVHLSPISALKEKDKEKLWTLCSE